MMFFRSQKKANRQGTNENDCVLELKTGWGKEERRTGNRAESWIWECIVHWQIPKKGCSYGTPIVGVHMGLVHVGKFVLKFVQILPLFFGFLCEFSQPFFKYHNPITPPPPKEPLRWCKKKGRLCWREKRGPLHWCNGNGEWCQMVPRML